MALFGRLFGQRKPAAPKPIAPRGHATGWTDQDFAKLGRPPFARWQTFAETEVEAFLSGAEPLFVQSSNVGALAQYYPDDQKLMLEFHGGRPGSHSAYLYSDVSPAEAESFARADSKGSWVWDHLRVRGSKDGHRKPYVRLR